MTDYPVTVRIDPQPRSSRVWAVLTLFTIKLLALLPQFIVLAVLGLARFVAFVIAQVAVLVNGTYPPSLHRFVTGVVRWNLRVGAFLLSVTDRYPPFSFEPDDTYAVDVKVEYPERSSRLLAGLTVLVVVISIVLLARSRATFSLGGEAGIANLRGILLIPQYILLFFVAIAVFFVWIVAQFVILARGGTGKGIHDFFGRFLRWTVRIDAFAYGLTDRYPPFGGQPEPDEGHTAFQREAAQEGEAKAA